MLRAHLALVSKSARVATVRKVAATPKLLCIRYLASTSAGKKGGAVPENFYDEEVELFKELTDIQESLASGGLHKLTSLQVSKEVDVIHKATSGSQSKTDNATDDLARQAQELYDEYSSDGSDHDGEQDALSSSDEELDFSSEDEEDLELSDDELTDGEEVQVDSDESASDDFETESDEDSDSDGDGGSEESDSDFVGSDSDSSDDDSDALKEGLLVNPNELWRKDGRYPDELLKNFIPATSGVKHDAFSQGNRACPGKLQRRGRSSELRCHKIDLDTVNFIDVVKLKEYLSEDGEILGKRDTGLCSKCQRKVAKTIKHSRNLGLLPHIGQFAVQDSRPTQKFHQKYHDTAPHGSRRVDSKTVL